MKKCFFAAVLLAFSFPAVAQLALNGVTLPASLNVEATSLTLNGGGIRKKAFFKLYVAGLYLEKKTKNAEAVVNDDKPMAVRLQITSSMINSDNMTVAINEGFEKSLKGNVAPLKKEIDSFVATFNKEAIKEGDVFDLFYNPAEGVKAYKNNKLQTTIKGLAFKKALFGIWFSGSSVDDNLRVGMLGG